MRWIRKLWYGVGSRTKAQTWGAATQRLRIVGHEDPGGKFLIRFVVGFEHGPVTIIQW